LSRQAIQFYNEDMNFSALIPLLIFGLIVAGCISRRPDPEKVRQQDRERVKLELNQEMSLKEDRDSLNELRKEVPADTQKSNDELALFLNLIKQGTETPQTVRDKFNGLVMKKRSSFREKVERLRNKFRDDETLRRETFMRDQQKKRDNYLRRKHDPRDQRDFLRDLEKDRVTYFADERDRRSSFESEIRAQSRDFDSYMRERQKEFDEQYRIYSKKFSEKPKEKKAVTGDEFKRLNDAPAAPLGTDN
jgi:hypothetical protein